MKLEERMDALEHAHREMAAQHIALKSICQAMFTLIKADPASLRRALLMTYDTANSHMENEQLDEAFQAAVRHWLDVFSEFALMAEHISQPPQNPSS